MSTINTRNQIGIDKALQYAVTFAWEELQATKPRSIRVEYLCEPGAALNQLSVWSARAGGYQDLVFDYSAWTSSPRPEGARLAEGHPAGLPRTLDFIMQHQNRFTRPADAGRHGLVLVYPPREDDRTEAATWIRGIETSENETCEGGAPSRPAERSEGRPQNRVQQASAQAVEQACPGESTATVSDATGYSGGEPAAARQNGRGGSFRITVCVARVDPGEATSSGLSLSNDF